MVVLPSVAHIVSKGSGSDSTLPTPSIRIDPRFLLQLLQFRFELIFLPPLLVLFPSREFLIQRFGRSPFLPECVLLDLVAQEQHHVMKGGFVWIGSLQVGQQLLILEFRVGQQVVLPGLGFGEETVLLRQLVFAGIAYGTTENVLPLPIDLQAPTFAAHLVFLLLQDAQARFEGAFLSIAQ